MLLLYRETFLFCLLQNMHIRLYSYLKGSYDAFLKIIILCVYSETEYVDML